MNIYLELFGYAGTALVLTSMMMNSMTKLRIFNICGSVISMIYAALSNTWPVVFLITVILAAAFTFISGLLNYIRELKNMAELQERRIEELEKAISEQ